VEGGGDWGRAKPLMGQGDGGREGEGETDGGGEGNWVRYFLV